MSGGSDEEALRGFVKSHRVHYSVEHELVVGEGARRPVGFAVRLFAVHDKGARALPGCAKSRALADALRSLAEWLVCTCPPTRIDVEPYRPALYDSRVVPGADEVALTIRLSHSERYADPLDASQQSCLKVIRGRLKVLAIPNAEPAGYAPQPSREEADERQGELRVRGEGLDFFCEMDGAGRARCGPLLHGGQGWRAVRRSIAHRFGFRLLHRHGGPSSSPPIPSFADGSRGGKEEG